MPEIKSPFLRDKDNNKNTTNREENSHNIENGNNIPPKNIVDETRSFTEVATQNKTADTNNGESIEIKKESQLLRVVITVLIIALVLALLGLILYNIANKDNKIASENEMMEEKINFEIPNFEMRGEEFKAGSVTVE